jgi:hypothetical protein
MSTTFARLEQDRTNRANKQAKSKKEGVFISDALLPVEGIMSFSFRKVKAIRLQTDDKEELEASYSEVTNSLEPLFIEQNEVDNRFSLFKKPNTSGYIIFSNYYQDETNQIEVVDINPKEFCYVSPFIKEWIETLNTIYQIPLVIDNSFEGYYRLSCTIPKEAKSLKSRLKDYLKI